MSLVVDRTGSARLFEELHDRDLDIVGPTIRDGTIVYDRIATTDDLPIGWTDRQEAGSYRLARRSDGAFFGYVVGPDSLKRFLYPPRTTDAVRERIPAGLCRSTHTLGPIEAVEVARALGSLPARVTLIGIEGGDFSWGTGLSPEVEAAVERVVLALSGRTVSRNSPVGGDSGGSCSGPVHAGTRAPRPSDGRADGTR